MLTKDARLLRAAASPLSRTTPFLSQVPNDSVAPFGRATLQLGVDVYIGRFAGKREAQQAGTPSIMSRFAISRGTGSGALEHLYLPA